MSICRFSIIIFFVFFALVNVCIILIFPILNYIYWCFHVFIKEENCTTYRLEEVLSEQVPKEHGVPMLNKEQVNDLIEEDDHNDNIVEDDGTNTLIHDSFNFRMDDYDDNDDDDENSDDFDNENDIPLLDKAYEPLYEGSKTILLSAVLLIMNLKVMNGLSNILVTQMLRYVIHSITYI